jgi:predicted DNA-binding protein with PD1-like motif
MYLSIKTIIFAALFYCITVPSLAQQKNSGPNQRFVKTTTGYLMVLRESDDVIPAIEYLAKTEKIPSGNFTGIGFAQEVTFGFYDFKLKQFNPKTLSRVEMGSLTGSIAWSGEKPSIHVHGISTDSMFNAHGGHILSLKVGTGSMEIYITVNKEKLERKVEQPLNANVLQLNGLK